MLTSDEISLQSAWFSLQATPTAAQGAPDNLFQIVWVQKTHEVSSSALDED